MKEPDMTKLEYKATALDKACAIELKKLTGNLDGAKEIRDAANAKAMDLLVKFADRVQAIRKTEEMDAYFNSIDYLEHELESSFNALRDRVGNDRAREITRGIADRAF